MECKATEIDRGDGREGTVQAVCYAANQRAKVGPHPPARKYTLMTIWASNPSWSDVACVPQIFECGVIFMRGGNPPVACGKQKKLP